jgi:hypothetical protein
MLEGLVMRSLYLIAVLLLAATPAAGNMCKKIGPDGSITFTDQCDKNTTPLDGWCQDFLGYSDEEQLFVAREGIRLIREDNPQDAKVIQELSDRCIQEHLVSQLILGCEKGHPYEVVMFGATAAATELCRRGI